MGAVLLFGIMVYLAIALRSNFPPYIEPEDYAALEELKTKVVSLPHPWHSPAKPTAPEAEQFAEPFVAVMVQLKSSHTLLMRKLPHNSLADDYPVQFNPHVTLDPGLRSSWPLLLSDLQPIILTTSETVNLPTYSMEANYPNHNDNSYDRPLEDFAELVSLASQEQVREGNFTNAFELALLPLRQVKRTEQAAEGKHWEALYMAIISLKVRLSISLWAYSICFALVDLLSLAGYFRICHS